MEFADFWIADQLNSLTILLLDTERFFCYLVYGQLQVGGMRAPVYTHCLPSVLPFFSFSVLFPVSLFPFPQQMKDLVVHLIESSVVLHSMEYAVLLLCSQHGGDLLSVSADIGTAVEALNSGSIATSTLSMQGNTPPPSLWCSSRRWQMCSEVSFSHVSCVSSLMAVPHLFL